MAAPVKKIYNYNPLLKPWNSNIPYLTILTMIIYLTLE